MTVDKSLIRTAIVNLFRDGHPAEAQGVWDLLDDHIEMDTELTLRAADSPAVREIEGLLARTLLPRPRPGGTIYASDNGPIKRCPSHYLSTENEELVQCQGFAGHTDRHSYQLDGQLEDEAYYWTDDEAFGFEAFPPASAPAQRTPDPCACPECGSTASIHECVVDHTNECQACKDQQRIQRDWAASCHEHAA